MSVTLREKKNKDKNKKLGSISLYLDIYDASANPKRRFEFLNHLKLQVGTGQTARSRNQATRKLAEEIALERAHQITRSDYDIQSDTGKKTVIVTWIQKFIDGYELKDKRNMQGALNRFKDYLGKDKEITFNQIDATIIRGFLECLKRTSIGEGASCTMPDLKK